MPINSRNPKIVIPEIADSGVAKQGCYSLSVELDLGVVIISLINSNWIVTVITIGRGSA